MPNGSIDPSTDYVVQLRNNRDASWPTITRAREDADALRALLGEKCRESTSGDYDIVVFGSLARREWTSGSDVDWTLLIDGQASPYHRKVARTVEQALENVIFKGTPLKPPGGEGIFGKMTFSHEIVHHIGGQADTNRNTTQRILLLLEATTVAPATCPSPYERIVRQILNRYLGSDSNFRTPEVDESRIPRFLLNDIVRYWRTICVDFAYKDWEQAGKKWALRNLKLRMSRKLLFVSGLFTVLSCFRNDDLRPEDPRADGYFLKLQEHLLKFAKATPLNIIAWTLCRLGFEAECVELLGHYEQFLAKIDDKVVRAHLTDLSETKVYSDPMFLECREISHELQRVLRYVCLEAESPLRDFTCEYGVF
jgi:predicted nucleotidyltransferase